MNTWISRRILGFGAGLGSGFGSGFGSGLGPIARAGAGLRAARRALILAVATLTLKGCGDLALPGAATGPSETVAMAGGAVQLATPPGYCVDRRALRQSPRQGFALIARCDRLGARGFAAGQRLALITVTTLRRGAAASPPTLDALAAAAAPAEVLERRMAGDLPMLRLRTPDGAAARDLSPQHWRTAFALNGHLVGLTLYAPEGSAALGAEGMTILGETAMRIRRASARPLERDTGAKPKPGALLGAPKTTGSDPASDPAPANSGPLGAIAGLFQ